MLAALLRGIWRLNMRAVGAEGRATLYACRIVATLYLLLALFVCALPRPALAQASSTQSPWDARVRGSWVQTGPAAKGDVVLAARGSGCEIVVGGNENSAVQRAAEFLAGDIEKISGYRPALVQVASGN